MILKKYIVRKLTNILIILLLLLGLSYLVFDEIFAELEYKYSSILNNSSRGTPEEDVELLGLPDIIDTLNNSSVNISFVYRTLFWKRVLNYSDINIFVGSEIIRLNFWEADYRIIPCHDLPSYDDVPVNYEILLSIVSIYVDEPSKYVVSEINKSGRIYNMRFIHVNDYINSEIRVGARRWGDCDDYSFPVYHFQFNLKGEMTSCTVNDKQCMTSKLSSQ